MRFRLSVILAASIGLLVTLAVLAVLAIQLRATMANTFDLLNEKALFLLKSIENDIASHLNPVREQIEFIAGQIERGAYDIADRKQLQALLTGALAPLPQVDRIVIVGTDLQFFAVRHGPGRTIEVIERDVIRDSGALELRDRLNNQKGAMWGTLIHRNGTTYVRLQRALRRNGRVIGYIVTAISTTRLSRIADNTASLLSQNSNGFQPTAFILYGPNNVLAHPNLISDSSIQSIAEPAVSIRNIGDIVLSELWNGVAISGFEKAAADNVNVVGISLGGIDYVSLYKWTNAYGDVPWAIGLWAPASDLNAELLRLNKAALAGLGVALVAIFAAIMLGRRLAGPIRRVATNALKIGRLDLQDIEVFPRSRVREFDDEAAAFNTMLAGLRSFETYVPRTLVARLMQAGGDGAGISRQRRLTVMFTDIVGYTAVSENMSASEVAFFLNDHFTSLGNCVEAEDGTIDKFIGDSLMAFWGAPDEQQQTEQRACRAAIAIARTLTVANEARRARGLVPVRLRIGIHTGDVVVGNIGSPGRINYTIVGDTVNVCQRLEALGKEIDPDSEIMVLVSKTVTDALDDRFSVERVGNFEVKGRMGTVDVFRLNV